MTLFAHLTENIFESSYTLCGVKRKESLIPYCWGVNAYRDCKDSVNNCSFCEACLLMYLASTDG